MIKPSRSSSEHQLFLSLEQPRLPRKMAPPAAPRPLAGEPRSARNFSERRRAVQRPHLFAPGRRLAGGRPAPARFNHDGPVPAGAGGRGAPGGAKMDAGAARGTSVRTFRSRRTGCRGPASGGAGVPPTRLEGTLGSSHRPAPRTSDRRLGRGSLPSLAAHQAGQSPATLQVGPAAASGRDG